MEVNDKKEVDAIVPIAGWKAIAALANFRKNPIQWVSDVQKGSHLAKVQLAGKRFLITSEPDHAQHVLKKSHWNYRKSANYNGLRQYLGNGLLTSEGDFWRRQRKQAQPAFHKAKLDQFVTDVVELTSGALQTFRNTQRPVDIQEQMMNLTVRIITKTMFSTDMQQQVNAIGKAVTDISNDASRWVSAIFPLLTWFPTTKKIAGNRGLKYLDNLIYSFIENRRKRPSDKSDLLSMFMQPMSDAPEYEMSTRQIQDEMLTIFSAGHETTALALTWLWHVVSQNPIVEKKLLKEAKSVLGDRMPISSDVARLEYTERVIKEVMRLYPPVWGVERQAIAADTIQHHGIPAGASVGIPLYTLHRHPNHWKNPEQFDPDRFLPQQSAGRHKFSYLPFGAGPRICIGAGFAMMEAKIITAMILRDFHFHRNYKKFPGFRPGLTLRPKNPITMTVSNRD